MSISKGNHKLGTNFPNISKLVGNSELRKKDGTLVCETKGTCGEFCKECKDACYAKKAELMYKDTLASWLENTELARNDIETYFNIVRVYIKKNNVKRFRWNVGGEIESLFELEQMNEIAKAFPNCKFGVYTKNFKVLKEFLDKHENSADNFVINISEWHGIAQEMIEYAGSRCSVFEYDDIGKSGFHCKAVDEHGKSTGLKCQECMRCYTLKGVRTLVHAH